VETCVDRQAPGWHLGQIVQYRDWMGLGLPWLEIQSVLRMIAQVNAPPPFMQKVAMAY
jgi:hypothetical protein